jgi:hypothetical protein
VDIASIALLVLLLAPAFLRAQDLAPASLSGSASPSAPVIPGKASPVIEASRLIALLPEPPASWSADKPEGSTTESDGFQITTVSRTYVKGDADNAPTATVNIIDSANNQQFQDATKAMWSATSDTPEGYDKAVTIVGLPGFEHFANADQTGVLWVIVAGRFFVQVETTRQPAADLEAWLTRLDLKKLGALK